MKTMTRKLIVLAAIAVGVVLAWRWWKHHSTRNAASPDDPLLSKAIDAISGASPGVAASPFPGGMPLTTNPGILPPSLVGSAPQNSIPIAFGKPQTMDGTPILNPERLGIDYPQRNVVLA